jgi:P-type Ca2+ transporter type 2C
VLLDDDFASIVRALRLGRRIYDNLRKAMAYIVAVHLPIAGLALLPLLMGWPLLLTPMLIAMLELVIDPTCSIVFEAEHGERDLMRRPPRRAGGPVLSARLIVWSVLQGALALAAVCGVVVWATRAGRNADQVRLLGWLALIGVNMALVLTNRRHDLGDSARLARADTVLWWCLGLTATLAALTTLVPLVRGFLSMQLPAGRQLLVPLGVSLLLSLLLQLLKPLWARDLRA